MTALVPNASLRPKGNASIALGREAYGIPSREPVVTTHLTH